MVFSHNMGRFLKRGEQKKITLYLNGNGYEASVRNVNFNPKFKREKNTFQIRYPKNGELTQSLQAHFSKSYNYIKTMRELRTKGDCSMIKLPNEFKEYLAIYTTEYEDIFIIETIEAGDITILIDITKNQSEKIMEDSFNYDFKDKSSTMFTNEKVVKIRKLNRKIGDNLKLLYGFRCQICGMLIDEDYDATNVVEAHHIDYFINSLNNDSNNLLIVCPNHHSIIHDVNPVFDRKKLIYLYPNGYQEELE